ncbi:cytochrome c [Methylocaldum sp.]|uniref:cytochrome c n=1 Tax=Methylocaldum sp. TaxID=1969727 RepID=UPI002D2FFCCE|nr:cytochrome c [Methylocaldum sp.]HYE35200.1 cytochrome c [Methylocaldum sp.]
MSAHAMKMLNTLLLALVAAFSATALADEEQIKLKEGAGRETVMANCVMCHSIDYIPMNSPFMKKADWQATIDKMVKVMGAPISQDDIPVILDYLTKYYGVE